MPATKNNIMVVKVPYVAGTAKQRDIVISEEAYRAFFKKSIEGNPPGGKLLSYVHPQRNMSAIEAQRNYHVLTESPVVYIVVFRQTKCMLRNRWLALTVGDNERDQIGLYKREYVVYVGETNNIVRRTNQHLRAVGSVDEIRGAESYQSMHTVIDERTRADRVIQAAVKLNIPVWQYVIWDRYFTKSMTLDMENKFIDYSFSLDNVFTLNSRGNPQRNYYKAEEKDVVCSRAWRQLSLDDPVLFRPEHDIWNSELYKVSPFHSLGKEQSAFVNTICENVQDLLAGKPICGENLDDRLVTSSHRLIMLSGVSGTGKSIVVSTLFVRLSEALRDETALENSYGIQPNNRVCLVVNQSQQQTLYSNLAKKIGLTRRKGTENDCVYKATGFINAVESGKREMPDVVLIDEAHLLRMTTHMSYGKKYRGNQLYDILLRAKVVIAVIDPVQVMRKNQSWSPEAIASLFPDGQVSDYGDVSYLGPVSMQNNGNSTPSTDTFHAYRSLLSEQFRIDAGEELVAWIDRLADLDELGIKSIPLDTKKRRTPEESPFDIRVFRSPKRLAEEIDARRKELQEMAIHANDAKTKHSAPLCRLLATYDWRYDTSSSEGYVQLYRVRHDGEQWVMPVDGQPPEGFSGKEEDVFLRKWNYTDSHNDKKAVWSANPAADDEVGSYFSVQGFDLNYAGVIIGPSITYRNGHIVVDKSKSKDGDVFGNEADRLIVQQLKVLLRRSIHGLYLFAVDPGLRDALEKAARASGRFEE